MTDSQKYLALCLDPVHIGTGGYRLGRVDMSIVREPATGIPKIPGTSLAGVVRAYAEMAKNENPSLPDIKIVFGTTDEEPARQGMLRFFDVQIVLFPVSSQLGTVWVSTAERLKQWLPPAEGTEILLPESPQDEYMDKVIALKGIDTQRPINLGWLLLEVEPAKETEVKRHLPLSLSFVERLAVVSEKIFHHLVNDNLEVRTSVVIDDQTGAAEPGKLFTYEAIPRGTVMGFEIASDHRRKDNVSENEINRLLEKAFGTLKILGIGGMGTRGFGRLEVVHPPVQKGGE